MSFELWDSYLAYPHSNGFADGGHSMVVGRVCDDDSWALVKVCLLSGVQEELCRFRADELPERGIWFDISLQSNLLAMNVRNALYLMDLNSYALRKLYAPVGKFPLLALCSISPQGDRVVEIERDANGSYLVEVDTSVGRVLSQTRLPVGAVGHTESHYNPDEWNHQHYSPFDSSWIGFCNNARTDRITDRLWGWHARHAPQGNCLFDQTLGTGVIQVYPGHERWCFHDVSAIVVTYWTSPNVGAQGIWEIFADNRPAGQVVHHRRAMHCDISRDGRWIVFDTYGAHDAPLLDPKRWQEYGWLELFGPNRISDVMLFDRLTGEEVFLARSHMGPEYSHPWHPHPCFSPDGRTVFFNDYSDQQARGLIRGVAISHELKNAITGRPGRQLEPVVSSG